MRGNIVVVAFSDFESRRRFVIGFFHLRIFWLPLVVVVVYLLCGSLEVIGRHGCAADQHQQQAQFYGVHPVQLLEQIALAM